MPNIRPVSDLRNYTKVLRDVTEDSPVFLTKNGCGRYVIIDIKEYEKTKAALQLMDELGKGEKSEKEKEWLSSDAVKAHFKNKQNKI